MIRRIFIDAGDVFFVDDDGDLIRRDSDGKEETAIVGPNLAAFARFLDEEARAYLAQAEAVSAEAEGHANG